MLRLKSTALKDTSFVKTLRIDKGMTQQELADKCEMSRRQIIRIEQGKVLTGWDTLLTILNALGWNVVIETDGNGSHFEVSEGG